MFIKTNRKCRYFWKCHSERDKKYRPPISPIPNSKFLLTYASLLINPLFTLSFINRTIVTGHFYYIMTSLTADDTAFGDFAFLGIRFDGRREEVISIRVYARGARSPSSIDDAVLSHTNGNGNEWRNAATTTTSSLRVSRHTYSSRGFPRRPLSSSTGCCASLTAVFF